ncbi:MAG: hypothetical protein IT429_17015 [Gemmataceae bacterium]|nr:hypothetical protein [Gemmataceae bacterium]
MHGQNLKALVESDGLRGTCGKLREALGAGELRTGEFSVRELAEAFCGSSWVSRLHESNLSRWGSVSVMEAAGEGVDVTAFSNITGQLIFSEIHQGWEQAVFVGDRLFRNVPTKLDGEKIPGIGRITGEGETIHPGKEYPEIGFGEQYWETPSTTKHGMIVSLTKETIFFDRTALVLKRAGEVGERLRMNKEKRQLACFAGLSVKVSPTETFNGNNHVWKGVSYNTYQTASNAIGINAKASTELVDWSDVQEAEQLFVDLLDPDTGNPVLVNPTTMVVTPRKFRTAKRILSATEVRHGDHDAANAIVTIGGNPVASAYEVLTSPILYQLLLTAGETPANARNYWWLGEPQKAFWYMENWPLTVVQAPVNSEKEFSQDIVQRWKASERGVPWCADPRYNAKLYDAATI